MTGKNQHFIPSFLQRAFGIQPNRKEIWYFHRDEAPNKQRIKRTASEEFFYSSIGADNAATLDDKITMKESSLSAILNEIRSLAPGDAVASPKAAEVVLHLTIRTKHVRASFSEGVDRLLDRAQQKFSKRENIEALISLEDGLPNERFRNLIVKELAEVPEIARLGIPTHALVRLFYLLANESSAEIAENADNLLGGLRPKSTKIVRDSHNQALGDAIQASEHKTTLQKFDWTVAAGPAAGAILPDCVSVGLGPQGVAVNHLLIGGNKLQALLLAVSPKKLLVGCSPGFSLPSDFDYNLEAARFSHSFFLAQCNDEETERLQAAIGQKLRPALAKALEYGFDDAIEEWSTTGPRNEDLDAGTIGCRPTPDGMRYEVSLVRCGDEHKTAQIQHAVQVLVNAVAATMPLERLDGITIGYDYPGLLKAIERGWDNAPAPETAPSELGTGIAQTVLIKRMGVVRGRIVMSSMVTDAMISGDSKHSAWGIHAFVRQLATVAQLELVEARLPGAVLGPAAEGIDGWLYPNVSGAPDSYAASWMAAAFFCFAEVAQSLRELLAAAIDRLMTVVLRERLAYREHGNLDTLLGVALPEIRRVLLVAADLFGHCEFTGESPIGDRPLLGEALDHAGLRNWFGLYGDHLSRFHRRLDRQKSLAEYLTFNIHVERLLWAVGMFAWGAPDGLRVEVPLGTDTRALAPANPDQGG